MVETSTSENMVIPISSVIEFKLASGLFDFVAH